MEQNIFEFIKTEENAYKTTQIPIEEGWEWNMREHIRTTVLYKNSKFTKGANDGNRPYKNIVRPILNLRYRTEGFDVKDVELFVNDIKKHYKSFLVKKWHEKWAYENDIDTFIDELVETYIDFGGVLVKDLNDVRPEVIKWPSVAFCDQTDILSGPIGLKHQYAPDQLMEMASKGWGKFGITLEDVIILARESKQNVSTPGIEQKTPGKYIEVYEVHGMFPRWWMEDKETGPTDEKAKDNEYSRQMHIVAFYKDEKDNRQGVTLFRGPMEESAFKFMARDAIYGRALGFGGVEELVEPQVWTNYSEIRKKELLDAAAKVIFQTEDQTFRTKNQTKNLDNGEILVHAPGGALTQVNTTPASIALFDKSVNEWEAHAQLMGAANDSILGRNPASGTPFKLQELVTMQSSGEHEYHQGKLATFVGTIYRDWIIPRAAKEIARGQQFLAELSLEELQQTVEYVIDCEVEKALKEAVLSGKTFLPEEVEAYKQQVKEGFMRDGNKKFIEIFEGEMKDAPIDVYVNIAGKQKDLAGRVDKLVNVFRQIFAAPQILQDPTMAKLFNEILEASGLNPMDFYTKPPQALQPAQVGAQEMMQQNKMPATVGATQ